MFFPDEWWEVVEVIFATSCLDGKDYSEAIKNWRKTKIGRGHALKARAFDNAVGGARKVLAGGPETVATIVARTYWYTKNGIRVAVARPVDWKWQQEEIVMIRLARRGSEPKFLAYDENGIDEIPGPATKENPWDKWRI